MNESRQQEKKKLSNSKNTIQKEIEEYKTLLKEFKITFNQLTAAGPKDSEIRKNAMETATLIAKHENLSAYMMDKKKLPMKELDKHSICPKFVRANKKYIMALSVLFIGNFTMLQKYLDI